jgi:3D (Asp-Asp-Asp) domain-containing protein
LHKVTCHKGHLWYGQPTVSGLTTRSRARLVGIATALALAAGSTAAAAGPGSGYRAHAAQLRVQAQLLDTRAHRALLDLYALDSRLAAAQRLLSTLASRSALLSVRQARLSQALAAARLTLAISRQQLADRLRGLYEQGTIDPLAVLLGASSLDDALTRLNDLSEIADQSRRIVEVAATAHTRLTEISFALAQQRRELGASLAAARRSEQQLAAARADKTGFLDSLRAQKSLKETQIRSLLATAQAVQAKAQKLQAQAALAAAPNAPSGSDASTAPVETTAAAPPTPVASPTGQTLTVSSTGYSLPGHTATGLPVGWGVVAVDPSVIPLGTKLTIPGYGEGVAADVGPGVRGATIDLWFPTLAQARAWGRRTLTITLH